MLTRETLNELHKLTADVTKAKEVSSELLRVAQDRHGTRTHKLQRDGKEVELKENTLWEEVWFLGAGSQAGQILSREHPQLFEAYKVQDAAANALKKFAVTELGLDFTALTLSDYLKMTEELFDLMLRERELPTQNQDAL